MYHTTGFTRDEIVDLCASVYSAELEPGINHWPPILGLFKSLTVAIQPGSACTVTPWWLGGGRAGCEGGREPGSGGEQLAEGVEGVDAPLGGGGQAGLNDRELGQSLQGAPAAAGAALLHLDGSY